MLASVLAHIHGCVAAARHRIRTARGDEGMSTLEIAVIALGLLAAATAVVAAITSAVDSRLEGIQ